MFMQEYNQQNEQQIETDLNSSSLWTRSIIYSFQQTDHSALVDLPQFKTCLDPQTILNHIKEMEDAIKCAEDKDVVFILGSTGSGKTTTVNFLRGRKMELKIISETVRINGVDKKYESKVITTKEEVEDFKIGHKKESQTLFLKAIELEDANLIICDSPGFKDSRGINVEIANSICLTNFIKKCRSIVPILMISIDDLNATKGRSFKDILNMISDFIIPECMKNILFFFTHLREHQNINDVENEIIGIYTSLYDNGTPQLQELLKSLLISFDEKRAYVVSPLIDSPADYIKMIQEQEPIKNTIQSFKINTSEEIQMNINQYSNDLQSFVRQHTQNGFLLESIVPVLDQYLQIKDAININLMKDVYNKCVSYVIQIISYTKNTAFQNLLSSVEGSSTIDENCIKKMKKCIKCLTKLDRNKNPHFIQCQLSEQQIMAEIFDIIDKLKNEIDLNNLTAAQSHIRKIEQLSQLSPHLQNFASDIQQFIEGKLYLIEQKNNDLIKVFMNTKDVNTIQSEIERIANNLMYYQELDHSLSLYILDANKYYNEYKTNFSEILRESFSRINKQVKSLNDKVRSCNITPEDMVLPFFDDSISVFDLQVLKKVQENKYVSNKIESSNTYYAVMVKDMQALSVEIYKYLIENSQKKKYLQQYAPALQTLDQLRNLDEIVQQTTEKEHFKLIQSIKDTILQTKKYIKEIIQTISGDQRMLSQSSSFIKSSAQNRGLEKLKKYIQFFQNISWVDEKLKTRCVQSAKEKMKKSVQKYFNYCLHNCEELVRNKEYQSLKIFLECLENLKVLKEIIEQFDEGYNKCIDSTSKQIQDYLMSVEEQVQYLNENHILPTKKELRLINDYLLQKKEIKQIKCIPVAFKYKVKVYLNSIFQEFENIVESNQTFEQINNLINNKNLNSKGIQYWTQFVDVIDFCNNECKIIKETIGISTGQKIIQKIYNIFNQLMYNYLELSDNSENNQKYLNDLTFQYNVLEQFTEVLSSSDSLAYIKIHLSRVPKSQNIIKSSIRTLQKNIADKKLEEVEIGMKQLRNLSSFQNEYEINILKLKEIQSNILSDLEDNNKYRKDSSFNLLSLKNNLNELLIIQGIINESNSQYKFSTLLKQNPLIDQEIDFSDQKLSKSIESSKIYSIKREQSPQLQLQQQQELEQLLLRYFQKKQLQMIELIKNLKFSEFEDQFDEINKTIKVLEEFNSLFQYNFITTQIKNQSFVSRLQKEIISLHSIYPEKKLVKLYKYLQNHIIDPVLQQDSNGQQKVLFYANYQTTVAKCIIEYSNLESEKISELLTKPNLIGREIKSINKLLSALDQFVQKLKLILESIKKQITKLKERMEEFQHQIEKRTEQDTYFQLKLTQQESIKKQIIKLEERMEEFQHQIETRTEQDIYFQRIFKSTDSYEDKNIILSNFSKTNPFEYKQIVEIIEVKILESVRVIFDSYPKIDTKQVDQIIDYLHFNSHFSVSTQSELQYTFSEVEKTINQFLQDFQNHLQRPNLPTEEQFIKFFSHYHSINSLSKINYFNGSKILTKFDQIKQMHYQILFQIQELQSLLFEKEYKYDPSQMKEIHKKTSQFHNFICGISPFYSELSIEQAFIDFIKNIYDSEQLKTFVKSYFSQIVMEIKKNFEEEHFKELKYNLDLIRGSQEINKLFGEEIVNYENVLLQIKQKIQGVTLSVTKLINECQDNTEPYMLINLIYSLQNTFKDTHQLQINEQIDSIETDLQFLIEQSTLKYATSKIHDGTLILKKVIKEFPPLNGQVQRVITDLIKKTINQLLNQQYSS